MDDYPRGSLDHNIPFLLTLGVSPPNSNSAHNPELGKTLKDQAIEVRSDLPTLDLPPAQALLHYIQERDASNLPCIAYEHQLRYRFRVKSAERSFLLPPRRARLPEGIEAPPGAILHSPFSPLTPISPLYPDGLIDAQWTLKHQELIPSVVLCFYNLVSDPNQSTLSDNHIKSDVNKLRNLLIQSGHKIKLAIVFLSDPSGDHTDYLQDRIEIIRRGCALDPKSVFLMPPNENHEDLARMAENMLITLYGASMEYYKELGRHSRKKRGRGVAPPPTVPPTTGTSQTLSLAGWNVRYDFKSAVLAEFRLEMENALRSYEQAYENLLSSEVVELIPSWSPRWNEARLLADVIAIRSIRCLLWGAQNSAAVRRWQFHRERMADLVERLGRGTSNYGWEAWQARWAIVMANLMEKAGIPELDPAEMRLYLNPEKNIMGERLQPWEFLHHTGYWYRLASRHLYARRARARAMPEDDRRPPGSSPASHLASRGFIYDTFMCPEPHEEFPLEHMTYKGVDHNGMIIDCLSRALHEFLQRDQARLAAELSLELARELSLRQEWAKVVELLRPIWQNMPFRKERWPALAEEVGWALRAAASKTGGLGDVVTIDWELLDRGFTKRKNWQYDITKSLQPITPDPKPLVNIADGQIIPPISATFVFRDEEGKAGQTTRAQLCLRSNAHVESAPVPFSRIEVKFNGSINTLVLRHQVQEEEGSKRQKHGNIVLCPVPLEDITPSDREPTTEDSAEDDERVTKLQGTTDLTLSPGHTLVLVMDIPLREQGEVTTLSLTASLETESFDLHQSLKLRDMPNMTHIWYPTPSTRKRITRPFSPLSLRILPRPPKMEIKSEIKEQYYTNEAITLDFDIYNAEDVEAPSKFDALLFCDEDEASLTAPSFTVEVVSEEQQTKEEEEVNKKKSSTSSSSGRESKVSSYFLGDIQPSTTTTVRLHFPPIERPSRYELTLRVVYHLSTNPGTTITQTAIFQLNVLNPFEANYELLPRVHPDPWPSFFDAENIQPLSLPSQAEEEDNDAVVPYKGLHQSWSLLTRYASFASEDLKVVDVDVKVLRQPQSQPSQTSSPEPMTCLITRHHDDDSILPAVEKGGGHLMKPHTIETTSFDIVAQKFSLDDRGPAPLDLAMVIRWKRLPTSPSPSPSPKDTEEEETVINTTTLPCPRFSLFGIEPRVLAHVTYLDTYNPDSFTPLILLRVIIENASNHFLTFGVSMDTSSEFAFSGPKLSAVPVLPVSRREVEYRLLPTSLGPGSGETEEREEKKKKDKAGEQGYWIKPGLTVRDKYFQKVLRVIPASEGVRVDAKDGGFLVWVPTGGGPDDGDV
ncbi:Gryzun, putative trafficking through golgi-domain-containing protein [Neurospora hispaniola]|uniref:Gryzun, putative trafficking through golgi-domain-containing protein n=1 Tax=Neurospora hispaniola TaxID=588809 RepID=A0AAJ0I8H2_9PEZI|nr:Gryzun, putative trafficking through golgi-domain-containing protein [Neurospora hispaniola]